MGKSVFTLTEMLLENLKGALPTVEEIEADFDKMKTQEYPEGKYLKRKQPVCEKL